MLNYEYHVVLSSMVIHIMVIIIITHHPKCKPQGKETATAVCSASGWKLPADEACSAATRNTRQIVHLTSILYSIFIINRGRTDHETQGHYPCLMQMTVFRACR